MWILFAVGSSFCGNHSDSRKVWNSENRFRCGDSSENDRSSSVLMADGAGHEDFSGIHNISRETLLFLVLSGLATGASWLCYFHALQKGDVNKVVPIDKSSTILTIFLALIFLHEGLTWAKFGCVCLIAIGTYMMISRKKVIEDTKKKTAVGLFMQCFQQSLRA